MSVSGALQIYNNHGNPSDFSWTGGTLTFLNGVTINPSFYFGSSVSLGAGLTLGSGTTFVNNGSITLNGGSIAAVGALTNNSTITGNGTIAAASGANNYQIIQSGGNLTINASTSAFINNYNLALASGYQLIFRGAGLSIQGSMQLAGANVTGLGTLANAAGGTITGPGLITAPFTNAGTVVVPSGQTNFPPLHEQWRDPVDKQQRQPRRWADHHQFRDDPCVWNDRRSGHKRRHD